MPGVGGPDGDAVTPPEAAGVEGGGGAQTQVVQLGVTDAGIAILDGDAFAVGVGGALYGVRQGIRCGAFFRHARHS